MDKGIIDIKNLEKKLVILEGQYNSMTSAERRSKRGKSLHAKITTVKNKLSTVS